MRSAEETCARAQCSGVDGVSALRRLGVSASRRLIGAYCREHHHATTSLHLAPAVSVIVIFAVGSPPHRYVPNPSWCHMFLASGERACHRLVLHGGEGCYKGWCNMPLASSVSVGGSVTEGGGTRHWLALHLGEGVSRRWVGHVNGLSCIMCLASGRGGCHKGRWGMSLICLASGVGLASTDR